MPQEVTVKCYFLSQEVTELCCTASRILCHDYGPKWMFFVRCWRYGTYV